MRDALKEAGLQNPVLTNRNGIRGIIARASNHVLAKPEEYNRGNYVDAAGIGGRKMLLPGEIPECRQRYSGKSAEVIVVTETSRQKTKDSRRPHQSSEGLNIKLFQIRQGGLNPEFASLAISGTGKTNECRMIRSILNGHNLRRASRQVVSNKGSAGIDGIPVQELIGYFDTPEAAMLFLPEGTTEKDIQTREEHLAEFERNKAQIIESIMAGKYMPQPIRGVEIPKENGKYRLLGIPTVTDRMLQQAVHQIIYPLFEVEFKSGSYGFRPKRNAQQAVLAAQRHINEGYGHIVDIDLKTFFDEVDHSILMQLLYRKIKCPLTLRLIRKWLRAPIMINGKLTKRRKGVPQGSPLSPLLSNIMLHELDKELERRKLRYVRYADDFSIYTTSDQAARIAGNDIYLFLKNRLKLPINREKSGIRKPVNFKILGFRFVSTFQKGERGQYQLVASEKSWKRFKQNLKAITRKTAPFSFDERIRKLKEVQRGWVNYFRMASIHGKLKELDGWVRNRLRYCIWHDWNRAKRVHEHHKNKQAVNNKPERRRKSLIRLGVKQEMARSWSRTRMGGWATAQSPILVTTITLKRLMKRGYQSALDLYLKISPQFNEPLITRPV